MRIYLAILAIILFPSNSIAQQVLLAERLLTAVLLEDTVQIKEMISAGADPDAILPDGRALIVAAAMQSTPEVIEALVNAGANPNTLGLNGYSAVMLALQFGQIDNAKKLQALGASLSGISDDGYTVRLLAENVGLDNFGPTYPASFNVKMSVGEANQILLYASEAGDLEAVNFALTNGGSVRAKASNGWTPAMLAGLGGHASILEALVMNDALKTLGIYHDEEGVDLLTAILVGEGGNATAFWDNVEDMLRFVLNHKDVKSSNILEKRGAQYRAIAEKLEYPPVILNIFPEVYEPLPRIESVLPTGIPATKENWKRVQGILKANGLYKIAIDGDPGRGTMAALLEYYLPLVKIVKARSIEAAKAADRNSKTAPLRGPQVKPVCRKKEAGTSTNTKTYSFCGEFKGSHSTGIFTAEFSGYTLSKVDKNRNLYGYITGDSEFSIATRHMTVIETYNLPTGTQSHTYIRSAVLDDVFHISIHDTKIEYYFQSNFKKKGVLPGKFDRPKRPAEY